MDKELHDKFYKSKAWQKCRAAYIVEQGGLCERCLSKGLISTAEIVHHKQHLDENTIKNTDFSLNFDNLECLCMKCHNSEHFGKTKAGKRWQFVDGKLVY